MPAGATIIPVSSRASQSSSPLACLRTMMSRMDDDDVPFGGDFVTFFLFADFPWDRPRLDKPFPFLVFFIHAPWCLDIHHICLVSRLGHILKQSRAGIRNRKLRSYVVGNPKKLRSRKELPLPWFLKTKALKRASLHQIKGFRDCRRRRMRLHVPERERAPA